MRVWRLCSRKHAATAFDGEGARRYGGRWNPPGVAVVYTAGTLSLAALELLVNLGSPGDAGDLVAVPAEVPDTLAIEVVQVIDLPRAWRDYPAPAALPALGARWVQEARSVVLSVPSVVIPGERNFVLNPAHPRFKGVRPGKPERFAFDPRVWKKS